MELKKVYYFKLDLNAFDMHICFKNWFSNARSWK